MTDRRPPSRGTMAAALVAPSRALVLPLVLAAAMAATPAAPAVARGSAPAGSAIAPAATSAPPLVPGQPAGPSATNPTAANPGATPADTAEDIRDIRGPKYIANPWLIPALLGAVLLVGLVAYGLWRWQRRRRRPRILLPFEIALQRLEEIRPLMQPPSAREFSTAASDIIRSYIEQRFDVIATHRTTEEFLHDLLTSSTASLARHRPLLEEFLNQCDLVKFAGISLSMADMESLHDSACRFVKETAAPDPPAGAAPTATATAVATATPTATGAA